MILSFPTIKSTRKSDLPNAGLGLAQQDHIHRSPCIQHVRARRSGVLTLFVLLVLVIAIGMLMLVLNTAWLVLNNRDMQRRNDLLALVATEELLDEQLLWDQTSNQIDDVVLAETVVHAFRVENNQVVAKSLRLDWPNVTVTAGRVEDVNHPVFIEQMPFNSLRVELHRYANGSNPALLLIRGFGTPEAADVMTASVATLDNCLIGFRPTATVATPLAPLAISETAWFTDRPDGNVDTNANNRLELDVLLRPSSSGGVANGALVDVGQSNPLNVEMIPHQILDGIRLDDLPPSINGQASWIGPVMPGNPLPLPASETSPDNTDTIAVALNAVATSQNPRRIFAIYTGAFTDPLEIVGFVGATVLEAENIGGLDDQLRLAVEPVFIVHFTAVTDATNPAVPENTYIHKLRLVQ